MKVVFLAPYPFGKAPSQRFRFEHFIPKLVKAGHEVRFEGFLDDDGWDILYSRGNHLKKVAALLRGVWRRAVLLFQLHKYDMAFVHREAMPLGPPVYEWIMAKVIGLRFIYDYDDAIWLPNTSKENKIAAWLKWHHKVASICQWAATVSAGNEYLAAFARPYNDSVVVLPTVVDTSIHTIKSEKVAGRKIVVGWTGSHSTLPYLDELVPILQQLEASYDFEFLVIADKNPQLPIKGFRFLAWSKESEIDDLAQIDIGVMPLHDDEWAKGKCGFKAIQFLALGIPAVVSPVGVNAQIVTHGESGFLCSTPSEWADALAKLLDSADLRTGLGNHGRQRIEEAYSVSSQEKLFFSLFGL